MAEAAFSNESKFEINVIGSKTGKQWVGAFTCKILLGQLDECNVDRRYREILGLNSHEAGANAQKRALVLAEVFARVTDAPSWWAEKGQGCFLLDDEPLTAVYNACMKAAADFEKEKADKAERARVVLAGAAPKGDAL